MVHLQMIFQFAMLNNQMVFPIFKDLADKNSGTCWLWSSGSSRIEGNKFTGHPGFDVAMVPIAKYIYSFPMFSL